MNEQEPTGWVVVFLRVDQPTILAGSDTEPQVFKTRNEAEQFRTAVCKGNVEEHDYLTKKWARVVVWSIEAWWRKFRGESERVFLPAQPDDNIKVEDMNPQEYE